MITYHEFSHHCHPTLVARKTHATIPDVDEMGRMMLVEGKM